MLDNLTENFQTRKQEETPPDIGSKLKVHKMPTNILHMPNIIPVSRCQKISIQGILSPINLYLFIFLCIDHF